MTRGDRGKLFILFVSLFTLSILSKIVCSLWKLDKTWMFYLTDRKPYPESISTLLRQSSVLDWHRLQYSYIFVTFSGFRHGSPASFTTLNLQMYSVAYQSKQHKVTVNDKYLCTLDNNDPS